MLLTDAVLERNAIVGGKFRVIGKLGGGGMGVVYEGEHIDLKQKVAIKVIVAENQTEEMVRRFRREALVMAQLESDHVVRVMDYGSLESGAPYLVMEFLRGMDLHEYLAKYGRFLLPEVAEIGVAACDALTDAHSKGIVHRDLKPSNLFLADRSGGRRSLKVLDFGLSFFHLKQDESITKEHTVLGTPLYAAPELFGTTREIDGRADIWALGATLFELATGQVPFPAASLPELAQKLREGAPDASTINPKIPPAFAAILAKCLRWEPSERYATARELRRDLRGYRSRGQTSVLFGQAFPDDDSQEVAAIASEELDKTQAAPPPFTLGPTTVQTRVPETTSPSSSLKKVAYVAIGATMFGVVGAVAFTLASGRTGAAQETSTSTTGEPSVEVSATPSQGPTLPLLTALSTQAPPSATAATTTWKPPPVAATARPPATAAKKPPPVPNTPLTSAPNTRK